MKILFIARHFTYFRNYDRVIRTLASRGHHVHLAVEVADKLGGHTIVEALAAESPHVTYGRVPERRVDPWSGAARRLRLGLDYLRYLDPLYDRAPLRRVRARDRTPRLLIGLADPPLVGGARWRRGYGRALHALDAAVPPPASIVDFVREQAPDVLLITPLVDLGSQQVDYVRAARQLGIPCGLAVWSWDHLTSKARLRDCPERVFVWNDTQREEAVRDHGVPAGRVVVTGAQCFDHWFDRQPSRAREAFCATLGLPPDRPLILYVCTGLIMGSPPEADFVREWLGWLRGSGDPALAGASVLVRPHPSQLSAWNDVDLSAWGPAAVWGGNPIDDESRSDYFDSLYHSAAVIGLNTSAFIEAGIVGREVLAILVPRYHDNQEGTAHFRYLRQIGGGLLRVSRGRDEHLAQLGKAVDGYAGADLQVNPRSHAEHPHRAFLEAFVRPFGLSEAATPRLVSGIEDLRHCVVEAGRASSSGWRRAVLGRAVRLAGAVLGPALVHSPRERSPERLARIAEAQARQSDES